MIAAIWNKRGWTTATDARMLDYILNKAAEDAGFNIVQDMGHDFQPYGHTALWLLSESHLAVHTFPEAGKSYIELSSCIKAKFDAFVEIIEASPELRPEPVILSGQQEANSL